MVIMALLDSILRGRGGYGMDSKRVSLLLRSCAVGCAVVVRCRAVTSGAGRCRLTACSRTVQKDGTKTFQEDVRLENFRLFRPSPTCFDHDGVDIRDSLEVEEVC